MAERPTQSLTTGARAPVVRRALGPTAWTVLEALLTTARTADDGTVLAETSVRHLAHDLGLACGTVRRALAALRCASLVEPEQARRVDGAFASGAYVLRVPGDVIALASAPLDTRPTMRSRRVPSVRTEQLALLPE